MVLCVAVRDMLRKRGERRGDLLADLRIGDRSFWPDGVARGRLRQSRGPPPVDRVEGAAARDSRLCSSAYPVRSV